MERIKRARSSEQQSGHCPWHSHNQESDGRMAFVRLSLPRGTGKRPELASRLPLPGSRLVAGRAPVTVLEISNVLWTHNIVYTQHAG